MRYLVAMLMSIALFESVLIMILVLTVPEMTFMDYKYLSIFSGFLLFFMGALYLRRPSTTKQED